LFNVVQHGLKKILSHLDQSGRLP